MAQTRLPAGFLFPNVTMIAFVHEIICFYFWSVSRRYADLIDIAGMNGEDIGRIPMENADKILSHHDKQVSHMNA